MIKRSNNADEHRARARRETGQERRARATREALLKAGSRLYAEHGLEGVSLSAIARAARVNKALVAYHFGGKRGLYDAILATTFDEVVRRMESLSREDIPAEDMILKFLGIFHEMAARARPHFPALMLRDILSVKRSFACRRVPQIVLLAMIVRRIIERGIRRKEFRPVDPLLAHLAIVGGLVFFYATEPARQQIIASGRVPRLASTSRARDRALRGRGVSVRAGDCPDATHVKIAQPKASDFIEHYQEMIVRALRRTPQPRNKKKEVRHAKASLDSLNRDGADRRWLRKKRK